jgi:hypothetical protein
VRVSPSIDLHRSLERLFDNHPEAAGRVRRDADRQEATAQALLGRMLTPDDQQRREMVLLADEVGLGKTYVALAVAVSLLDAVRRGEAPAGLPANRPAVLVLTPENEALYQKWLREAAAFQTDCARDGTLSWLDIRPAHGDACANVADLTALIRRATRSRPVLAVAKTSIFGKALADRGIWRRRALAAVFNAFGMGRGERETWCRRVLGTWSEANVGELLDLRKSGPLWDGGEEHSADLRGAYERALTWESPANRLRAAIEAGDTDTFTRWLDWLTRAALCWDWQRLPLVVIDEVHNLKTPGTARRENLAGLLQEKTHRLLGLSATPFQLRHEELESVLGLRCLLALDAGRRAELDRRVGELGRAMSAARDAGAAFRQSWQALKPVDAAPVAERWAALEALSPAERMPSAQSALPPRAGAALASALRLESANSRLETELRAFVIRHRHERKCRKHYVGREAQPGPCPGADGFAWRPGVEADGPAELAHYLLMRAVALAKDEKGLPPLGAELTGSYRHLTETAAVWRKLNSAKNEQLRLYHSVLNGMLSRDREAEHPKIRLTVERVRESFRRGQKSLVFCVYIQTAEAVRDEIDRALTADLAAERDKVFGGATAFENFRRRFFNVREPLYALIQDHPLIGASGVPEGLRLGSPEFRQLAGLLAAHGEPPTVEKPDRRLLLAAVEHVAATVWARTGAGEKHLADALGRSPELIQAMCDTSWLRGREAILRKQGAGDEDEEEAIVAGAGGGQAERWMLRLGEEAVGEMLAPYFKPRLFRPGALPLLPRFHAAALARLGLASRAVAGQVFRRLLKADEFLLRYLTDAPRERSEHWADYLSRRYVEPLDGRGESLCGRVSAYLDTLGRAQANERLAAGYHEASRNRNMVQLVKGGMADRDRFFLGFNTPFRPEVLVATEVGQEGIDLHRECRHVIHHDLCWNPATIEQRTGRIDRIGSKSERESAGLDVAVPYLAATYDERMFEELYRRAQLFEVTMGGDFEADGRAGEEGLADNRLAEGIGAEGEDLGVEGVSGEVDLPPTMAERLRIDLAVWKAEGGRSAIWEHT